MDEGSPKARARIRARRNVDQTPPREEVIDFEEYTWRAIFVESRAGQVRDLGRRSIATDEEWSWLAERARGDFDHWAAFQTSFQRLRRLLEEVGSGRRGEPPESIVLLSGDVHHAYLCDIGFRRDAGVRSTVAQAVCSP